MVSWRLVVLLIIALLLGYVAAYIPALQIPFPQAIHRWRPPVGTAVSPAVQIQGIGWMGTRTPYFDEAVTFFRDLLQMPLTMESPQFVEFQLTTGERLAIVNAQAPDTTFMKGPMVEFTVANVDESRAALEAAGVRFIGDVHRDANSGFAWTEFWGPDGHPYGLTSPLASR
jgi:catechol 2,3-dioxygenase-like lactoylglutathione lyase family enzyme